MKRILVIFLFAAIPLFGFPNKDDSNIMAGKIDILHYSINIKIDPSKKFITASAEITFNTLAEIRQLMFNLKEMNITRCTFDGLMQPFQYDDNIITISTREVLFANTIHKIYFEYSGNPKNGLIISINKYGHYCAFSDNWANRARYWFPSIDHPSDKATVSFKVNTPKQYEVIANGTFTGAVSSDSNNVTYSYEMDTPIPTYCMVIGVCDFYIATAKTESGIPIFYYTFPEDKNKVALEFDHVPEIVGFYEKLIGPYPYSKLAIVVSSPMFEGMENSSAIFLPQTSSLEQNKSGNDEVLAHEIAHQWFGDDVTKSDWPELWLSEGFATYFSMLYFEHREGEDAFKQMLQRTRNDYLMHSSNTLPVITDHYLHLGDLLNVENYQKGALFLHELRTELGDDIFFNGIKEYYRKFEHSNVTTKDFENVMESVSNKNLDRLFQDWLYKPGLPK